MKVKLPGNPWTSSLIYKSHLSEAAVSVRLRAETVQWALAGQPPRGTGHCGCQGPGEVSVIMANSLVLGYRSPWKEVG